MGSDSTADGRHLEGKGENGFSATSVVTTSSRYLGRWKNQLFRSHSFPSWGCPVLCLTLLGRELVSDTRQSRGRNSASHFLGFLFCRQAGALQELKTRTNKNRGRPYDQGHSDDGVHMKTTESLSLYWAPTSRAPF